MLPLSKTLLLKNRFAVFLLAIATTLIYYYGLSTANNRSMNENSKEEENAVNVIDIKTEELEFKEADDQTSLKELFD